MHLPPGTHRQSRGIIGGAEGYLSETSAKPKLWPTGFRIFAVKRYGYKFPVLLDPDHEALKNFSPTGAIPYTVLIDGKGEIIFSAPGNKTVDRSPVEQILQKMFGTGSKADGKSNIVE